MKRVFGFSVIEMTASIAMSALIFAALFQLTSQSLALRDSAQEQNQHMRELQFAFDRMVHNISHSRRVLLPLDGTPRDLFAVTLPATVDRDGNGVPDADNDGDGRIDEDPPDDVTNDEQPGIEGIDDDGDGSVDETTILLRERNDDEDGSNDDDDLNGFDDDDDGASDEDPGDDLNGDGQPGRAGVDDDGDGNYDEGDTGDDDEDGVTGEDWYDPVVYRLVGTDLIERIPQPWDVRGDAGVDGEDWVENVVLENVSVFNVQRTSTTRYELLRLILEVQDVDGTPYRLETAVRVGGGA